MFSHSHYFRNSPHKNLYTFDSYKSYSKYEIKSLISNKCFSDILQVSRLFVGYVVVVVVAGK